MRDEERSSRHRLRAAAKTLFAQRGYEATAIADITRAARTSHSQFLKYYSGKEELRREILEEQWSELSRSVILAMSSVTSATEKLKLALNMFITLLDSDPEFRTILLHEQTAMRENGEAVAGKKLQEFVDTLDDIIQEMKDSGELRPKVDLHTFRAALMGSVEGMMRSRLFAKSNLAAQYGVEPVRTILSILISSACDVQRPSATAQAPGESAIASSIDDDWIRYYLKLADRALIPSELS